MKLNSNPNKFQDKYDNIDLIISDYFSKKENNND